METLAVAGKLVFMGACLGIGFWLSKKATEPLDALLAYYDESKELKTC